LPKLNCGLCGYGNCGQFARAVAEREASPFGCQQNPWSGYRISQITGMRVPAYSYQFQPSSVLKAGVPLWLKALKKELRELSQTADNILVRIEKFWNFCIHSFCSRIKNNDLRHIISLII